MSATRPLTLLVSTAALACAALALAGHAAAATLYVAPGGSDANDCTDPAAACATLDGGYHAAKPGDVVQLADGTYRGQVIKPDPAKTAAPNVVIEPAPGASVAFSGRVTLTGTSFLTLHDLTFETGDPFNDFLLGPCNHDLQLENVSGTRFVVEGGNTNVTFHGGRWGGYSHGEDSAIGADPSIADLQTCGTGVNQPSRNIRFDGVTWHDVFWTSQCASGTFAPPCIQSNGTFCTPAAPQNSPGGPCLEWNGAHPDCFEIDGDVDGLIIENSTFTRCGDSFLALYGDSLAPVQNVTIRNNTFTDGDPFGFWSIQMSDAGHRYSCGGLTFSGNTFDTNNPDNPNVDFVGGPVRISCSGAPSSLTGNTFGSGSPDAVDCALLQKNAVWDSNTFTIGNPCGGHVLVGRPGLPVAPRAVALCNGAQCMFSYLHPITVSLVPAYWSSPITQIRYTLDESDPAGATALTYTGPIPFAATGRLLWTATDGTATQPNDNQDIGLDPFVVAAGAEHAYLDNGTLWFARALGGSFRIAATFAVINGPNPTHVSFPNVTAAGWSHGAEDVSIGPPFISSPYTWTAGAAVPDTQTIAGFDADGNERDDPVAVVDDSTAPVTTIACNGAACGSTPLATPVTVNLNSADAGGSGVARIVYTVDGSDPKTSLTARTYTGPFQLALSATVKWSASDHVGNSEPVAAQAITIQAPGGGGGGGGGGGDDDHHEGGGHGGGNPGPPDLRIDLEGLGVGGELFVRATVSNRTGTQEATGVLVTIELPDGLSVARSSTDRGTGCHASGSTLTCGLDKLKAGANGHVLLWARGDTVAPVVFRGSVRENGSDAKPADNADTLTLRSATPSVLLPARLTGRAVVGGLLRAIAPSWSGPASSVRYQWQRCTTGGCAAIGGAAGPTFRLTHSDAGRRVRVVVTATVGGRLLQSASAAVAVSYR